MSTYKSQDTEEQKQAGEAAEAASLEKDRLNSTTVLKIYLISLLGWNLYLDDGWWSGGRSGRKCFQGFSGWMGGVQTVFVSGGDRDFDK